MSKLLIRGDTEDNSKIIFLISQLKTYVVTPHLNRLGETVLMTSHIIREYARGRRERRNRFRPADVAFFSSESDKNVALIFRKIRCSNIHFNIHTCHDVISWCLTSGEVQHAIRLVYIKNRYVVEDPSGKAADVFPRKIKGIR